jgi:nucleotide-binding universal stress UspA family protein
MFNTVLAATDLRPRCDPAVQTAIRIAEQSSGEIYILHVRVDPSATLPLFGKHDKPDQTMAGAADHTALIKKDLASKWTDRCKSCRHYEIQIAIGTAWEEIIKWAQKKRPGLIVLGPHDEKDKQAGDQGPKRAIGSTIAGVVMREPCPVMIVNRMMTDEKLEFKNVVVGVDFSRSCSYALRFAIKLARERHSNLFLFHMLPIPPSAEYSQADYQRDRQIAEQKLQALCQAIPAGIDFRSNVTGVAFPHLEILGYAQTIAADLIVMGSHTKEKNGKWYVGSAVERVSSRAHCPVVVVSDPVALLN